MNIQELSTCSQYGCPVKIINLRNDYLGMVKQWQDMQYEALLGEPLRGVAALLRPMGTLV